MAKYATAPRQPKHTGKSGYVATQPGPKPYPWGIVEEAGSAFYPEYRPYIPKKFQPYSDSYYDLRNKQYKYWYDKWGKPHINKWWKQQLDETLRIKKAWEKVSTKTNGRYSYTKYYGPTNSNKYLKRNNRMYTYCKCGGINNLRKNGWRQRPRRKQRFSYW